MFWWSKIYRFWTSSTVSTFPCVWQYSHSSSGRSTVSGCRDQLFRGLGLFHFTCNACRVTHILGPRLHVRYKLERGLSDTTVTSGLCDLAAALCFWFSEVAIFKRPCVVGIEFPKSQILWLVVIIVAKRKCFSFDANHASLRLLYWRIRSSQYITGTTIVHMLWSILCCVSTTSSTLENSGVPWKNSSTAVMAGVNWAPEWGWM